MQEERMRDFFAADEAALAADLTAASAAVAAAKEVIAKENGAAAHVSSEVPVLNPYKHCFRLFRIADVKAYYSAESLEARLPMLGAESVAQLCKTIVMENTKHSGKAQVTRTLMYLQKCLALFV